MIYMAAIDPPDYVLVGVLVLVAVVVTSVLWIAYNSQLVWELKLKHQAEMEAANKEIVGVRGKLKDGEIQARVMGAMPVSKLITTETIAADAITVEDIARNRR